MKHIKRTAAAMVLTALLTLSACTSSSTESSRPEVSSRTSAAASSEPEETSVESSQKESSAEESQKESSAASSSSSAASKEESSKESSVQSSEEPESSLSSTVSEVKEPSMEKASLPESRDPVTVESEFRFPESKAPESKAPESSTPESSVPAPKPKPKPTPVTPGVAVDAHWFDNAVFVGDSVTLKLSYYADNGCLGDAQFLCAGSLGYGNALWELNREGNVHPVYNGTKVTVDEGLRQIDPDKIFIMLGMNDIGLYGVDGAIENMKKLTARIEEKCPYADIYIESVTPMLADSQLRDLNNTTIAQFDEKLQSVCAERGYRYMDIKSVVSDGYGNLVYDYCSDASAMGLHFSDAGCAQWVQYLKTHVY